MKGNHEERFYIQIKVIRFFKWSTNDSKPVAALFVLRVSIA